MPPRVLASGQKYSRQCTYSHWSIGVFRLNTWGAGGILDSYADPRLHLEFA